MSDTSLTFTNYPAGGKDATLQTVGFGAPSSVVNILVSMDLDEDTVSVTVGNGPAHEDAPLEVAEVLENIAAAVRELDTNEDYWEAVEKLKE